MFIIFINNWKNEFITISHRIIYRKVTNLKHFNRYVFYLQKRAFVFIYKCNKLTIILAKWLSHASKETLWSFRTERKKNTYRICNIFCVFTSTLFAIYKQKKDTLVSLRWNLNRTVYFSSESVNRSSFYGMTYWAKSYWGKKIESSTERKSLKLGRECKKTCKSFPS